VTENSTAFDTITFEWCHWYLFWCDCAIVLNALEQQYSSSDTTLLTKHGVDPSFRLLTF